MYVYIYIYIYIYIYTHSPKHAFPEYPRYNRLTLSHTPSVFFSLSVLTRMYSEYTNLHTAAAVEHDFFKNVSRIPRRDRCHENDGI
jgi:hypothetical protein